MAIDVLWSKVPRQEKILGGILSTFDHQEFSAFAIAPSDFPNQRTLASADHGRFISSCGRCHGFETDERHVCSQGDEVQFFEPDELALAILHEDDIITGLFALVFLIGISKPHRQCISDRVEEQLYFPFHYGAVSLNSYVSKENLQCWKYVRTTVKNVLARSRIPVSRPLRTSTSILSDCLSSDSDKRAECVVDGFLRGKGSRDFGCE